MGVFGVCGGGELGDSHVDVAGQWSIDASMHPDSYGVSGCTLLFSHCMLQCMSIEFKRLVAHEIMKQMTLSEAITWNLAHMLCILA